MRIIGAAGVPCGACQDMGDILNDPHMREREMIVEDEHPARGKYSTIGCAIKLSDSPFRMQRSPLLGEHSETLLAELCEVGSEELARLRREGVT